MNLIRVFSKVVFASFLFFIFSSCEKDVKTPDINTLTIDTLYIPIAQDFIFNLPFNQDTFFIDRENNIDFRIEIEGHQIDSAFLSIDNSFAIKQDTSMFSTKNFYISDGLHLFSFLIRSINSETGDTVFLKSKSLLLNVVQNLSNKFVSPAVEDGKLKLTWKEFDKSNTLKYIVERWLIDDKFNTQLKEKKCYQTFEVENASFIDNYYVGEEAEYKITVINKEGNKQDIWYYKKAKEQQIHYILQRESGGYTLYFTKCKYVNNFGQYYITDGLNANPTFIESTNEVNDTTLHITNAKFGGDGSFWIRYLPKQLPENYIEDDWNIYGNFMSSKYGDKSFTFNRIARINNETVAFTSDGKIFKYNIFSNQKTDSIINNNARYGFLVTTPKGDYLYATDEQIYDPPIYFWPTNNFPAQPSYTFPIDFVIPSVSDNLIAIMGVPSNVSPSKLALFDVKNENIVFTTDYNDSSNRPRISSNGQYYFINDLHLKLCSYKNNTFKVIWEESEWPKSYKFYDFNPFSENICYTWTDDKKFSTRSTTDYSEINSFTLDLENIISIDYFNKKIMGYVNEKLLIYNLENGALVKEIPADLSELIFYSNNSILIGNTIYNNHGIKYTIY
jgi:hypothetical protein